MKLRKRFPTDVYNETNADIDIFKNIYDGVIYYKDRYGNLVPIFQGEASIYVQDGTLTGDRTLTGAGFYLDFLGVSRFLVNASGDITSTAGGNINLNPGGEVVVADTKSISFDNPTGPVTALKVRSNPSTYIEFDNVLVGSSPSKVKISGADGIEILNGAGITTIENNLAYYSGTGNSIANITADLNPKVIPTREWVAATYPGTVTSVGTAGTVNGLTLTGGPITSSGTITLGGTLAINNDDWSGTDLSIANGGTGQSTQQAAINALTDVSSGSNGDLLTIVTGNAQWVTPSFVAGNLYTTNGTLGSNRTVDLDTFTLQFDTSDAAAAVGIGVAPNLSYDLHASATRLDSLNINGAYSFPTAAGVPDTGKALTYDGAGNLVFTTNSLYSGNDTVGTSRNATLTDTLTWTNGSVRRATNSMNVVEVTQESDFGAPLGGNITLSNDTTYIVRGEITCVNTLRVRGDGISIIGLNRNLDKLTYTGTGTLIDVLDRDFTLKDVWLSSTTTGSLLINASNVVASGFANGRTKVLEIINCQIRNCFNVMDINGFDLVDISNCLFFYVEAPTIGCRFRDTSKIEITSCEMIRWYDETNNALPAWDVATAYSIGDKVSYSGAFYEALTNNTGQQPDISPVDWIATGYSQASMIELRGNNLASFGAVNINGCIIHPRQRQNGIDIDAASTTGFGTISSNAFVNIGLTTGKVFIPEIPIVLLPDYSQTATYNYDVFANQGILNSVSGTVVTLTGNTTDTTITTANTPVPVNTGASAVQQAGVRYSVTAAGRATYVGTKQVYVSIHTTIGYQKQGGGTDGYDFFLYKNGAVLTGSKVSVVSGGVTADGTIALVYGTLMNQNDYIEIYVSNPLATDDILIKDYQMVIRE